MSICTIFSAVRYSFEQPMKNLQDRLKKIFAWKLLLIGIAACLNLRAQTSPDFIELIETGKTAEARARLAQMEKDNISREQVLFLKGLLTADGDSAVHIYERFLMLYPKSRFCDEALYRIAQHKYAKGLYQSAIKPLGQLIKKYPNSPIAEKCLYSIALCRLNLNQPDSAEVYFKKIIDRSSNSDVAQSARTQLASLQGGVQPVPEANDNAVESSPRYAVQVGAFSNQTNAVLRKSFFERAGYPVELRTKKKEDEILYLVWIGTYATMEEAQRTGEQLKNKYGLSYHLVTD
jgi:outer membrane protein assembly factor BamD (BamD/ComL family)